MKKKLWSKSYIFILLSNLFVYLSFYLLVPTLPAYAKQLGGSSLQASLVVSTFSISSLICRLVTGSAADKFSKKLILIIGLIILAACTFSYMYISINAIILFRIVQGIGWGMSSTAVAAAVSDIVPESRRGEGMGYYSLSMIISMSLAPIIAIVVMNKYSFNIIAVVSIILVVFATLSFQGVSLNKNSKAESINKQDKLSISDLFEKRALFPSFLCFILVISLCGIMSYIMLYGKEIKIQNIWIYFIGHVAAILITRSFVGKLFDKKGHAVVMIPGAISMILGLVVLSYTHSVFTLVAASLLYGFGYGAAQPSLQAWAVSRCPDHRKGAANGTFLSSMDLSFTVGSILLSYIAEHKSYAVMYRFSAVTMVVFLLIYGYGLFNENRTSADDDVLEDDKDALEEDMA